MSIFDGLCEAVETDYPLSDLTWFGLGGNADYLIRPETVEQLGSAVSECHKNGIAVYVLGYGSNLLVREDGVRGAVFKLEGEQFSKVEFAGDELTVGAGANLGKVVLDCVRKELSGLEALAGVPGSVGGAVRMNAGGNFGDIGSVVESVVLMDNEGNVYEKSKPELVFDYRRSNITAKFILEAKLNLTRSEPDSILRTIKEIWMYKKNTQPLSSKSAGCVFKNPRGLSAGALIDRAGLKGLENGGAVVSEKHANFIIAREGCKSDDIINLVETVRNRVREEFDVELELELEIW